MWITATIHVVTFPGPPHLQWTCDPFRYVIWKPFLSDLDFSTLPTCRKVGFPALPVASVSCTGCAALLWHGSSSLSDVSDPLPSSHLFRTDGTFFNGEQNERRASVRGRKDHNTGDRHKRKCVRRLKHGRKRYQSAQDRLRTARERETADKYYTARMFSALSCIAR